VAGSGKATRRASPSGTETEWAGAAAACGRVDLRLSFAFFEPMTKAIEIHAGSALAAGEKRNVWQALRRGWRCTCANCGEGALYGRYLKVNDACSACGTEFHHHRADDAPPYFVMTITAHVVVGGILVLEKNFSLDVWMQLAIWLPVLVLLSLWLLPRVKGALIAYQWALRMHGFGIVQIEGSDLPPAEPKASA
jgi:uncharacterized protein (DUF983 family)